MGSDRSDSGKGTAPGHGRRPERKVHVRCADQKAVFLFDTAPAGCHSDPGRVQMVQFRVGHSFHARPWRARRDPCEGRFDLHGLHALGRKPEYGVEPVPRGAVAAPYRLHPPLPAGRHGPVGRRDERTFGTAPRALRKNYRCRHGVYPGKSMRNALGLSSRRHPDRQRAKLLHLIGRTGSHVPVRSAHRTCGREGRGTATVSRSPEENRPRHAGPGIRAPGCRRKGVRPLVAARTIRRARLLGKLVRMVHQGNA